MEDFVVGSPSYYLMTALLLFGGVFTLVCSIKDYDWFMEHRKARFLARFLGRTGTRVFYGLIGGALVAAGLLLVVPLLA